VPDYTVLSHDGQRPWQGQRGSFIDHKLTVQVTEGNETRNLSVVVTQKPETPDPQVGSVIYGHLETQEVPKRDGTTFTKTKLKKDQRPDTGPSGGNVAATSSPQATPVSATPKSSDRGSDYWDEKDRRIEWAWACNLAAAEMAVAAPVSHKDVVERARIIVAQARSELSSQTPHKHPPPEAKAGGTSSTPQQGEGPPAEASTAQKRAVTQELNNKIPSERHAELREAAKAHTKDGASGLIDGLRKLNYGQLMKRYGLPEPPSELSQWVDEEGLPAANPEVEQMAAGQYDDIPF